MKITKNKSSVLVVDDQRIIRNLVGNILEENNILVYFAEDSNEAIKILNTHSIDLILLDIVMPGVDGFHFCKKIKETTDWKSLPVIFISSLSDTNDIVSALNIGGVDFIHKPFQKEELVARVQKHLEIKRIQDRYQLQLDELRKSNRYLLGTLHEISKAMEESRMTS
jgi:PleD family two-component response regulator